MKGQVSLVFLMVAIVVIIFALAIAPTLKESNDNVMNATINGEPGLDCSNSTISNFQKAQCYVVDITMPYFILSLIGIGGFYLTYRIIAG